MLLRSIRQLPAPRLLPVLIVAGVLDLPACGGESRADEPASGSEPPEAGASGPARGVGTTAAGDAGLPAAGTAGAVDAGASAGTTGAEAARDSGAVVVRDGRLVNVAYDFSLVLPEGVELVRASAGGDRFVLDRNGSRFLYASVERGSSLDPSHVPAGMDPGSVLPLIAARATCEADGPESSAYCTAPVVDRPLEAETGRPIRAFTLRYFHEDRGHEGPTRVDPGEAGPFYWIRFDGGVDGLRGLLLQASGDDVGEGEARAAARTLLETFRQPADPPGEGWSVEDPRAPGAVFAPDEPVSVRREPRNDAPAVGILEPPAMARITGRVVVNEEPEEPSAPWYEVERGEGGTGWVPAPDVAALVRASWDGRRLLFRSADAMDESVVRWFLVDRRGGPPVVLTTAGSDLFVPAPSLERYALLKRNVGDRIGTLEVRDAARDVLVHAAYDARGPRWEGDRLHYRVEWENPGSGALETRDVSVDPPRIPEAGTPVLVLSGGPALATPEIMAGEPVAELQEGEVVETTGAARGAMVGYGDGGNRTGLWLEVRNAGGGTGWIPAETVAYLVENGDNGLFRAATGPARWMVRGEMYDWGRYPFATYEPGEGERFDCYEGHRACFVDHGGDLTGTFTLFHGPTGEEVFHAEYIGHPPYWVREETVAYLEIVGTMTEEGWVPADYEEVRGRR